MCVFLCTDFFTTGVAIFHAITIQQCITTHFLYNFTSALVGLQPLTIYAMGLGQHLLCLKFYLLLIFRISQKFSPIILLCLAYYSKIRYICIRNASFKTVESNEIKSMVLAANCKQGTI